MGHQISPCLKHTFTIFNIIFAFIGAVIIALGLLAQVFTSINGELEGRDFGLLVLYIVGAITMVIAILGAYGACRESKMCLIVFLVCMVIGCMLTLRAGIPTAVARSKLDGYVEENFRKMLPLDKASDDVKDVVSTIQTKLHCCGLFSYEDWEGNIPDSCLCNEEEEMEGKCQTVTYRFLMLQKQRSVYIKSCFPFIMSYIRLAVDVAVGVIFTLAILALLGLILSSVMIHQMRYQRRPTVLMSVPTVFTTSPPKYQELHNPPPY